MHSPVRFDSDFSILNVQTRCFTSLGLQRGNSGIAHTYFLSKNPVTSKYRLGAGHQVNGYCSYRLLYNTGDLLSGVLFSSFSAKTVVDDHVFKVVHDESSRADFDPIFTLEPVGLVMFNGVDSSLIVLPIEFSDSILLITDD